MKLYYGAASPFVRKVAICIAELGLSDKVEFVACPTTPLNPNPDLAGANPIIKIPALELDNGTVLFDSSVICEYLDSLSDKATLVPASGDARWATLRLQAMANGAMEAGVLVRYETFLRPEALRWDDWTNAQMSKPPVSATKSILASSAPPASVATWISALPTPTGALPIRP
jgi:glutathione S-transferase